MVQAAFLDGQCLDHFSPFDDGCVAPEVNVGRRDVGEALVVAMVVVMIDEADWNLIRISILEFRISSIKAVQIREILVQKSKLDKMLYMDIIPSI